MPKPLAITPQIRTNLTKVFGSDIKDSDYHVYESIGLNSSPIDQPNTFFNKGIVDYSAMVDCTVLAQNPERMPLVLTMHNDEQLPIGKVLSTRLDSGKLFVQFAVDANHDVSRQIQIGLIDDVSMGFTAKRVCCSQCGFDFKSDPLGFFMLAYDSECPNGHQIGGDAHLILSGAERWSEISLCGTGAIPGAKIVWNKDPQNLDLAASGASRFYISLHSGVKNMSDPVPNPSLDLGSFVAQFSAIHTEAATLRTQLAAAQAVETDLRTQLAAAQAGDTSLRQFVLKQGKALETALSAVGVSATCPEEPQAAMAFITEHQAKLMSLLPPAGGVADPADSKKDKAHPSLGNAAFISHI